MGLLHRDNRGRAAEERELEPSRRFFGLFSRSRSRSRASSRPPNAPQSDNWKAFALNQAVPRTTGSHAFTEPSKASVSRVQGNVAQSPPEEKLPERVQVVKDAPRATITKTLVAVTELSDRENKVVDVPTTAFQEALASFSEEERAKLADTETIRHLFKKLDEADHDHLENSPLRKGLRVLKPYLERLNTTIDFLSPFLSLEPAAGAAIGLVKGSASIAIAICGRFEDMTKHVAVLLKHIPAIERCSKAVEASTEYLADIQRALVEVYKDLLHFYLRTLALFEGSRFVLAVALDILRQEIPGLVDTFMSHEEELSRLINAETFATVLEVSETLEDSKLDHILGTDLGSNNGATDFHDALQNRNDAACSWIKSDSSFISWQSGTSNSNLLALLGGMGSGKTMTTAFVAETLQAAGRALCAVYYCRDDGPSGNVTSIYRSILLQLLKQKPRLKRRFWVWHSDASKQTGGHPTQSAKMMRKFLYDIMSSEDVVFLVLDALDECEPTTRKQLLVSFQDLFERNARLRVFVSSRHDHAVEADLPPNATRIELRPSRDRDVAIATYLVDNSNIHAEIRSKVVEELASRANGSAIWLRIAVQYLEERMPRNEKSLDSFLGQLPSSTRLAQLYGKLFEAASHGNTENEALLQRALEILAVTRRPLTEQELAYAVFIINADADDPATLPELHELANSVYLFDLVRPFINASKTDSGKDARLRLVHQSLKELILTAPPEDWCSKETMAKYKKRQRAAALDADLLQRCIKYLLFDDVEERSLFQAAEREVAETDLLAVGSVFDDEEEFSQPRMSESIPVSKPASDFSPAERGFGEFFVYAATQWTSHFTDVQPSRRPDTAQLIALCKRDSRRLQNWVEQWKRPNCTYLAERDFVFNGEAFEPDPLTVTAKFGPAESVTDLLKLNHDSSVLAKDSPWQAVKYLIERDKVSMIKSLVEDRTLQSTLCSCRFFYTVMTCWRWPSRWPGVASDEWEGIFGFLISHLRSDLLEDCCANVILRRAAGSRCLVLIRKLLEAADADPGLRQALVAPDEKLNKLDDGYWARHQSIGAAAYEGHADVVRFLCERPELEPHLRYINHIRHTVFHQAARCANEEIFRTLIEHWPEGINIRNKNKDTPLVLLIFNHPRSERHMINLVRLLIHEGKADATGGDRSPDHSPLSTAVRAGYTMLLRVLVVEGGANPWDAVDVDHVTGRPVIRRGMDTLEDVSVRKRMLRELCSLLPLAASVEYLS